MLYSSHMNPILRFIIGIAIAAAGSYFVIRTRSILNFFGPIDWAERKLGGGGSYLLYKVIGIIVAIVGIIVAVNLWDWFLQVTLGSLFPTFR